MLGYQSLVIQKSGCLWFSGENPTSCIASFSASGSIWFHHSSISYSVSSSLSEMRSLYAYTSKLLICTGIWGSHRCWACAPNLWHHRSSFMVLNLYLIIFPHCNHKNLHRTAVPLLLYNIKHVHTHRQTHTYITDGQ